MSVPPLSNISYLERGRDLPYLPPAIFSLKWDGIEATQNNIWKIGLDGILLDNPTLKKVINLLFYSLYVSVKNEEVRLIAYARSRVSAARFSVSSCLFLSPSLISLISLQSMLLDSCPCGLNWPRHFIRPHFSFSSKDVFQAFN